MATGTMVRVYKGHAAYRKDAEKLARDGWQPVSVTERRPRSGCARILLLWFVVLIFPPKPALVVTYQRMPQPTAFTMPYSAPMTRYNPATDPIRNAPVVINQAIGGRCPNCGREVKPTAYFCPHCKQQLRG